MIGLWFFCVSVCVPTAAFQCKSTGGNDFFGFFPAFGAGNCFGAHFDKFFGHRTVLAFELVHWHVFHPNMLIYDLYSNDFLPVVNTSIISLCDFIIRDLVAFSYFTTETQRAQRRPFLIDRETRLRKSFAEASADRSKPLSPAGILYNFPIWILLLTNQFHIEFLQQGKNAFYEILICFHFRRNEWLSPIGTSRLET